MTANFTGGNRITLLKNGGEFFPALVRAIDGAKREVRIETYIFRDDISGEVIASALKRAAERGVDVRVIVDGFGSHETKPMFFNSMNNAGVTVLLFRPEYRWRKFRKAHLRRTHRKIVVIDQAIAFVGGINLIDDMTESLSDTFPRYDYALQIEGAVIADIHRATERLWTLVSWWSYRKRQANEKLDQLLRRPVGKSTKTLALAHAIPPSPSPLPPAEPISSLVKTDTTQPVRAAFVARDNFRHRRDIEHVYLDAVENAKKSILIVNSYFLPGRKFRRAIVDAAERGVHVTLLLQGRADHALMQLASRALYGQFLAAGVHVFEYQKSMLHGKVAVVDDQWATVGSSNLDPFSLFLNREANMVVSDVAFAKTLRASIEQEIEGGANQHDPAVWRKRSLAARTKSWLAYGLARLAAGWIGFRNEWHS
jgi:cardiolipin synthase A/B